jgi:hypothetical protein
MNCTTHPHLNPSQVQATAYVQIARKMPKNALIDVPAQDKLSSASLAMNDYCLWQTFSSLIWIVQPSLNTQDLDAPEQD